MQVGIEFNLAEGLPLGEDVGPINGTQLGTKVGFIVVTVGVKDGK